MNTYERDERLRALAMRYHALTETYDRTVCTGQIVYGRVMPIDYCELSLINRNAKKVLSKVLVLGNRFGFTAHEVKQEIGKTA